MAVAEELQVIIDAKVKDAMRDLKKFDTQMGKTEKSSNSLAKSLLTKFGAAAVAAKSVQMIVKFTRESAQAASDAEEVFSKFATVFADVSTEASDAAAQLANDFGLASSTAQKLIGDTGDLLTGFGLTSEEALNLSDTTNRLALDLASFTNAQGGAEAVSRALTSAYSGEREALKTYGIVISEAAVQAKILEQAQSGLTFETEQQAKIAATLAIAQEQSKNAIGDYARTADSAANIQRTLGEQTKRLKENYGALVLEGLTPVRKLFRDVLSSMNDNIEANRELSNALDAVYGRGGSDDPLEFYKQLEKGLDAQNDRLSTLRSSLEAAKSQDNAYSAQRIANLESAIALLESEKTSTELSLQAQARLLTAKEQQRLEIQKLVDAEKEAEAQRQQAAAEQEADLAALNDAFASTKAGQIAATEELIAYFETFKEGPKSIAVLEMLNEKLKEQKEVISGTTDISAKSWEERRAAILLEVQLEEDLIAFREAQAVREAELNRDRLQETLDSISTIYNAYSGFYSALTSLRDNAHEKELNAIDAEIQAAKDAGQDTTALEKEKQALVTSYKKKAWEADKRGKLLQATINTANAIAEALPNVGLAAAVGVLGAAQVGLIAAQSNPYRSGGIINEPVVGTGQRTGQQYSFGEAGPEMVSPTSGGGGDDLHVTINLDGQVISKFVTKAIRSNRILVDSRAVV